MVQVVLMRRSSDSCMAKLRQGREGLVLSIPLAVAAAVSAGPDELAPCLSRPFSGPAAARA